MYFRNNQAKHSGNFIKDLILTGDEVSAFCRVDVAADDGRLVNRLEVLEFGQVERRQSPIRFDRLEQNRTSLRQKARFPLTQVLQHDEGCWDTDGWMGWAKP